MIKIFVWLMIFLLKVFKFLENIGEEDQRYSSGGECKGFQFGGKLEMDSQYPFFFEII